MSARLPRATRPRSRVLVAVVALLAGALALTACTGKDAVDQSGGSLYQFKSAQKLGATIAPADRRSVTDLKIPMLNGGTYDLASDAGKVVVLNFWATWCSPCRTEMPGLDSLYRTMKSTVDFVGVNTKDTDTDGAKSFVSDNEITYPIVVDEAGKTPLQLGHIPASSLPFTVVLDKQHKVAAVYISQLQPADLKPVLVSLAAGH